MTLDYVEAIIPGDFVLASKKENSIETALGSRNVSQLVLYTREGLNKMKALKYVKDADDWSF